MARLKKLALLTAASLAALASCTQTDLSVITKPKATFKVMDELERKLSRKQCDEAEQQVISFWNRKIDLVPRTIYLVNIANDCKNDIELARKYAQEGIDNAPSEKVARDLTAMFFNDGILDEK